MTIQRNDLVRANGRPSFLTEDEDGDQIRISSRGDNRKGLYVCLSKACEPGRGFYGAYLTEDDTRALVSTLEAWLAQ